jgi:ferredoxin
MKLSSLCWICLTSGGALAFAPSSKQSFTIPSHLVRPAAENAQLDVDGQLLEIAKRLKLEVFDLDEGIFGFDSQDHRYGIEVVKINIETEDGLGLVLTEMAGNADGRGLVLVSEVSGNAAKASPSIEVGDVITGVIAGDDFRERTTGLNYDRTVEAIGRAKEESTDGTLMLELNRLVKRAEILVDVENGDTGEVQTIQALAGENLRRLILRKGIKMYDYKTKRFDMPFAQGDCAGEGLCGTCLVNVKEGQENLSPKDKMEEMVTKGRPSRWRASCRVVVGADNRPGRLRITTKPQSQCEEELNPGVKKIN